MIGLDDVPVVVNGLVAPACVLAGVNQPVLLTELTFYLLAGVSVLNILWLGVAAGE